MHELSEEEFEALQQNLIILQERLLEIYTRQSEFNAELMNTQYEVDLNLIKVKTFQEIHQKNDQYSHAIIGTELNEVDLTINTLNKKIAIFEHKQQAFHQAIKDARNQSADLLNELNKLLHDVQTLQEKNQQAITKCKEEVDTLGKNFETLSQSLPEEISLDTLEQELSDAVPMDQSFFFLSLALIFALLLVGMKITGLI